MRVRFLLRILVLLLLISGILVTGCISNIPQNNQSPKPIPAGQSPDTTDNRDIASETAEEVYSDLARLRNNLEYQIARISMVTDAAGDTPKYYEELWVYNTTTENKKLDGTVIQGWTGLVYRMAPLPVDEKSPLITQDSSEPFLLDTALPKSPETAPVYRVIATDSIFESSQKSLTIKKNIPSEAEAPALAEKVLESYGGLPRDANLTKVIRNTIKTVNANTGVVEEEYLQSTQVIYTQQINGAAVIGPGAEINIQLGENGELIGIEKAWRYPEYDRDVAVIAVEEAYEKLKRGETQLIYQSSPSGKKVTDVELGYYAEHRDKDQEFFTPVWIFYAAKEGETPYPYPVDAVKDS